MWKIPITGRDLNTRQKDHLSDLHSLPVFYMGEWSRLGLLVDRIEEAVGILEANGYLVETGNGDQPARVELSAPKGLREIAGLLHRHGIVVELGDVIDGIYRG